MFGSLVDFYLSKLSNFYNGENTSLRKEDGMRVEKKHVFTPGNQSPKKIHDLVVLLGQCKEIDGTFCQLDDDVFSLNPYYMGTRYPDMAFTMPDVTTAQISLTQAKRIFEFVQEKA